MSVRLNPETGEPLPAEQQEFSATRPTGGPFAAESGSGSATTPAPEHILQFFDKGVRYVGVPDAQPVLDWVNEVAHRIVEMVPRNPERTVALRKLLEAKESVVRAALAKG